MRKQFITLLLCLGSILGAQAQNERANSVPTQRLLM